MRVLITGINGFVGKFLASELQKKQFSVSGAVRSKDKVESSASGVDYFVTGDIGGKTNWQRALNGVDAIVHLAARVHFMKDDADDPLKLYREVNVSGTERLAKQAIRHGVRRFIYLSSIKVNGEERDVAYSRDDLPKPKDPYGISKWEAEQHLKRISEQSGLEVVIIRPPLVYGPGVKANFLKLLGLVNKGVPLPFGSLHNRRSMIFVGNLVSSIIASIEHPEAAGKVFLLSDRQDLSVTELLKTIGQAMGSGSRLIPVPSWLLDILANIIGRSSEMNRLTQSLCVDSSAIQKDLNWTPPYSVKEGIAMTVEWYLKEGGRSS